MFIDGELRPDDLRRLARALQLAAAARPQKTVLATVLSTQDRIDAGALMRWADQGVSLAVLPVMATEPQEPRAHTWPRLEDGADGR